MNCTIEAIPDVLLDVTKPVQTKMLNGGVY
jgi:hypothetical protein